MVNQKEIHKLCIRAISWLATEGKYLNDLKADLVQLEKGLRFARLQKNRALKDVKKALKDFKWVARSEMRFNNLKVYDHVMEMHQSATMELNLKGSLAELEDVLKRVRAESYQLIEALSGREGSLRKRLLELQDLINEKKSEEEVNRYVNGVLGEVRDLLGWINGLVVDIKHIEKIDFSRYKYGSIGRAKAAKKL
jgi:hypothetical protein